MDTALQYLPPPSALTPASSAPQSPASLWGNDGLTFKDILDSVNPLQQLPVVSTLYRAATGDTLSAGARLAGGALFGGPFGLASALVNVAVESRTGQDIGSALLTWASAASPGPSTPATAQAALPTVTPSSTLPLSVLMPSALTAYLQSEDTLPPGRFFLQT